MARLARIVAPGCPHHVTARGNSARADLHGLARVLGAAHRRWANWVNARGRWRGHLFDGRFASVAMDEAHLFAAVRYVSLNPVRAGLTVRAQDWAWSSVRAHLKGEDDGLVIVKPVLDRIGAFAPFLEAPGDDEQFAAIRAAETMGRALGTTDFVADLERRLGRPITRRAPGEAVPAGL
jgi:putative transposase